MSTQSSQLSSRGYTQRPRTTLSLWYFLPVADDFKLHDQIQYGAFALYVTLCSTLRTRTTPVQAVILDRHVYLGDARNDVMKACVNAVPTFVRSSRREVIPGGKVLYWRSATVSPVMVLGRDGTCSTLRTGS